jgi:hypothetical protein
VSLTRSSGCVLTFVIGCLCSGPNFAPMRGHTLRTNGVIVMRRHELRILCFWGAIFLASGAVLVSQLF